jgi:hypothetical protein
MCDIREKSAETKICHRSYIIAARYTHAGIVTFPVYLPYFSAQRCMIEIIFMPDIYENNQTCRPNSIKSSFNSFHSHDVAFYMYHVHLQMFLC